MYLSGKSLSELERVHGYNRRKLAALLQKDGIEIQRNNQTYKYLENAFDCIDSEENAYWLGFLYADGYISKEARRGIELCLAEVDKGHIEKFRNWICKDKPITEKYTLVKGKMFKAYRVHISNRHVRESLINLGCTPNKSLSIEFPQNIPEHLISHFVRGYVDGDGSIGIYSGKAMFDVCSGSEQFLVSLQEYFVNTIPEYTVVKIQKDKRSNVFKFAKGGSNSVISILNHLYGNANVYLQRKYDKYQEILRVKLPSKSEMT